MRHHKELLTRKIRINKPAHSPVSVSILQRNKNRAGRSYIYVNACTCACTHTNMHVCVHMCKTCMHTHMCTYKRGVSQGIGLRGCAGWTVHSLQGGPAGWNLSVRSQRCRLEAELLPWGNLSFALRAPQQVDPKLTTQFQFTFYLCPIFISKNRKKTV